jgi:hypothetical protein
MTFNLHEFLCLHDYTIYEELRTYLNKEDSDDPSVQIAKYLTKAYLLIIVEYPDQEMTQVLDEFVKINFNVILD